MAGRVALPYSVKAGVLQVARQVTIKATHSLSRYTFPPWSVFRIPLPNNAPRSASSAFPARSGAPPKPRQGSRIPANKGQVYKRAQLQKTKSIYKDTYDGHFLLTVFHHCFPLASSWIACPPPPIMTPSAHLRGGPAPTPCNPASSPTGFSSLPTELHSLVAQHLSYPDALSLKQTSRHFRALVRTGAALKVEWLLERRRLHLDCPNSRSCDLGSDLRFCRGSVQLLMRARRKHFECESRPGLGCLVFDTPKCRHRPRGLRWLTRWVTIRYEPILFCIPLTIIIHLLILYLPICVLVTGHAGRWAANAVGC